MDEQNEEDLRKRLTKAQEDDIRNRFTYHPVKDDDQARAYETIRGAARVLAVRLNGLCPPGRELALAITHLEETVFWANASISRHG